jgi:hypothetical protein
LYEPITFPVNTTFGVTRAAAHRALEAAFVVVAATVVAAVVVAAVFVTFPEISIK